MTNREATRALEHVQRAAKMLTPYYAEIYAAMMVGDVVTVRRASAYLLREAENITQYSMEVAEHMKK